MKKLAAVIALGVVVVAPSSAQGAITASYGPWVQLPPGWTWSSALGYAPTSSAGSFVQTGQFTVTNTDPYSAAPFAPEPLVHCGQGDTTPCLNPDTTPPVIGLYTVPPITTNDGCGTVVAPVMLGPWDGQADSTDSCTFTVTTDLTGQTPSVTFTYLMTVVMFDPAGGGTTGTEGGGSSTFVLATTVPMPPVDVATGDGSIDFGAGDTTASGDYNSNFAPAAVTVTKTTTTGTKTIRHLMVTNYGKHPWTWHGRNDAGARVRAGTYHLTVTVGGKAHTRKVVVR
jgi:hypothetical protein